jgi:hypothetical protein
MINQNPNLLQYYVWTSTLDIMLIDGDLKKGYVTE